MTDSSLPLPSTPAAPGAPAGTDEVHHADRSVLARQRARTVQRFLRHRLALSGSIILVLVVLISLGAPALAPFAPEAMDLGQLSATPPSAAHWLGTNAVGEDVLSRLLFGGRLSLLIGVAAALLSLAIGVAVGALAGWYGGHLDTLLMRFVDVMLSFPTLFLLLIFFSITAASVTVIVVFLGLFGWMYLARIVRGEFLSLKERAYVQSAQALGVGSWRIIWRHLLPNVASLVIVATVLNIAYNMLAEAGLDYLGFGVPPSVPTWGNMLTEASDHLSDQPLLVVAPGLALTLVIVSLHVVGDGLRDALDPRQT
jgi:peptide/nickel transport system permease protein